MKRWKLRMISFFSLLHLIIGFKSFFFFKKHRIDIFHLESVKRQRRKQREANSPLSLRVLVLLHHLQVASLLFRAKRMILKFKKGTAVTIKLQVQATASPAFIKLPKTMVTHKRTLLRSKLATSFQV